MWIVIPHVGKSHLTYRLVQSIPSRHHIVLVDGSYVQDMGTWAHNHAPRVTYLPTDGVPHCLAKNWNIGAAVVPESEPFFMFCATDIEFNPGSWNHISTEESLYPDCGIIKDAKTNWNVWIVRRWAWDLLKPMDEAYKPCAGEDDDLNMKCWSSGIKIRAGTFKVATLEGGHGSRLDMHRPGINSDRSIRPAVVGHFQRKWGIAPSARTDPRYAKAKEETYITGRRREMPPSSFTPPAERGRYGTLPPAWPEPLRLNLGCGPKKRWLDGFLNVDADELNRPEYVLDVAGEPWPWSGVDRIESYHLIEHLSRADGESVIRKAYAALRDGGTIALECPDLSAALAAASNGGGLRSLQSIFGNQRNPYQHHLWGYTRESLPALLEGVGFRVTHVGDGTDYHQAEEACMRVEAEK